jgi:hypothetical protein
MRYPDKTAAAKVHLEWDYGVVEVGIAEELTAPPASYPQQGLRQPYSIKTRYRTRTIFASSHGTIIGLTSAAAALI